MSVKRGLLIVLVASAIMLAAGGGSARARLSELVAAWPMEPGWMSGEVTVSALDNEQFLPSVAYNSQHNEYLVVWHNTWGGGGRDIYAQRISSSGELKSWFSITTAALSNSKAQPSVAYDPVNDRYLVVFIYDSDGAGSDWDLYGRLIPWDGPSTSLTEFPICTWGTHQWNPKVAYAGTQKEFLVVWANENQAGTPPMYISGRRVKASDGSFPGSGDKDLTISDGTENRVNPDVAYNLARNEYLVVYDNAVDVFATRLRGDAVELGGGEFGIAGWPETEIHPAVAACNKTDQYLVAWQSLQSGAPNHNDVYVRFIDGDGSFPTGGGPHVIYNTPTNEQNPDVACNSTTSGSMFLVTYEQQYSSTSGHYGVWGRFVYPNYSMSSAFGIVAGTASLDRTEPVVAGGGANYMVAWEHDRSASYQDIHGRLVAPYAVFIPLVLRNHQ
jgi:hypothetical protein